MITMAWKDSIQKLAASGGPKERGNGEADILNLMMMGSISVDRLPPSRTTRTVWVTSLPDSHDSISPVAPAVPPGESQLSFAPAARTQNAHHVKRSKLSLTHACASTTCIDDGRFLVVDDCMVIV